ncbi:hypothetical protein [Modestobacter sp. SYSU DS0290]
MSAPIEPDLPTPDDGIPAADPGAGAPDTAAGFGIGGEQPDTAEQQPEDAGSGSPVDAGSGSPADTTFHTPDPDEVGPESSRR